MQKQYGFTLVELVIVMLIISILVTIAYPSYQDQVRSSRRADCEGALLNLANALERFHTSNNTFAGATLGNAAGDIFPDQCPTDNANAAAAAAAAAAGNATYNLTITAASTSAYTIQAAPAGIQASDKCGTLTLTSTGLKDIVDASGGVTAADCW